MTNPLSEQVASTYPPHDCYAWQRAHWCSSGEYTAYRCGTCNCIVGFRWKKWSDRIRSLFTDEPKWRTSDVG